MSSGVHEAGQQFVDASVKSFARSSVGWYVWTWKLGADVVGLDDWSVQQQYSNRKGLRINT